MNSLANGEGTMVLMYIGPHHASDLKQNGLWNPETMTTDRAAAEASTLAAQSGSELAGAPMRALVNSEIVVPTSGGACNTSEPFSVEVPRQSNAVPEDRATARTSSPVLL